MPLPHFPDAIPNPCKLIRDDLVQGDIIFNSNNKEILKMNADEITITISGVSYQIKDDHDFVDAFNYVISEITGFENNKALMIRLREDARQDILEEIGVTGQRLLKFEKIFNTKKVKK